MDINCVYCNSENVYFSKKKQKYVCEDCERSFTLAEPSFVPRKVFLSYGHDDNEPVVKMIYDRLLERGHQPWIDTAEIKAGNDWRQTISDGILESSCFLAFVSEYSVRVPGVCLDEISIGVGSYNCRIMPVLLEKGVTAPNSISGIQWLDLTEWKTVRENSDPQVWETWIKEKTDLIIRMVEDERNLAVSGNISQIKNRLSPPPASVKLRLIMQNAIIPRQWLINEIEKHGNGRAVAVYGSPGTGKSVLSAYLCSFSTKCAAVYFFEWNNSATKRVRTMLCSLIFQLACNLEDYRNSVIKLLNTCDPDDMTEDELLDTFLLQPLSLLIDGGRERKIIVFDALDETLGGEERMLEVIGRLIEGLPHWLMVLITARPEAVITERLQQYPCVNIDAHRADMRSDICKYVNKRVSDPQVANKIIEKSDGSFLYAREAIELLNKTDMDLDSLPPGIGGAYYSSFCRIFTDTQAYARDYLPFFEAILAAKEQLTRRELSGVLGVDGAALRTLLRSVRSYVYELADGDDTVLQVFHKSFLDWLISESAGVYRVSIGEGDRLFSVHLLSCVKNGGELSEYLVKFGLKHVGLIGFDELAPEDQRGVLNALIEGATRYGLLENEAEFIAEYERCLGKDHTYYHHLMDYDKKTSGERLRRSVDEALAYMQTHEISEQQRFDLVCQIAFSYFYAGLAERSFELITAEREKHGDAFWKTGENEATYWHALALSAHDLDKNDVVVAATEKDIIENRRQRKYYTLFVSMVNLFDGYMALGRLDEADRTAKQVLRYVEDRYYMHADDIIKICYANLLLTEGRVTESLAYYESGLALAKKIQHWDYLYGSVWRELAVARFGDRSAIGALQRCRALAKEANYSYIISLSLCFDILSAHLLGIQDAARDTALFEELRALNVPGHVLQAAACLMLDGAIPFDEETVLLLTQKCAGVKGHPEIVCELFDRYTAAMTDGGRASLDRWCAAYVRPITAYKKRFRENLTKGLSREIRLTPCCCPTCAAKCCYDGVYLTPQNEKDITDFVNEHPDMFPDLPKPFITDGDWPGMRSKRKTEKIDFDGYDESFPAHFTKTRCVFALPSGECSLQRAATDLQLHPWKIKPIACWFFPLRTAENGDVLPPITDQDPDPHYLDESYPGYVSFLPCVRRDGEGIPWFEKYENEIEYYAFLHRGD